VPANPNPEQRFPVRLTQAQRKVVADIAPELAGRLKLTERNQRTIRLTLADVLPVPVQFARNEANFQCFKLRHYR
jgi:hypothetical protein